MEWPSCPTEYGLHFGRPRQLRYRVFDLTTLKVMRRSRRERTQTRFSTTASRHVLSNHTGGDITVIDPAALDKTVTIQIGGTLEYAVADGAGHVFVCVEDKNEVVQIDTKANTVLARWSLSPGDAPTGLDIDLKGHRLFVGCGNRKMIVLDSTTGSLHAEHRRGRRRGLRAGVGGPQCQREKMGR